MSHIGKVKLQVKNLPALKRACKALGLVFHEGQTTWQTFYSQNPWYKGGTLPEYPCHHAISVPNDAKAYEIGVLKVPGQDGFSLYVDTYGEEGAKMTARLGGDHCNKLVQEYGAQVAEEEAEPFTLQGWQIERVVQKNGDIQVVLQGD